MKAPARKTKRRSLVYHRTLYTVLGAAIRTGTVQWHQKGDGTLLGWLHGDRYLATVIPGQQTEPCRWTILLVGGHRFSGHETTESRAKARVERVLRAMREPLS